MEKLHNKPFPATELDDMGYMQVPAEWTPDIAEALAHEQEIGALTDDHWKVIVYMRQYYLEFGMPPPVRKLSRETGFSLRRMKEMFPTGLAEGACKIAGLPREAIKPSFLYP